MPVSAARQLHGSPALAVTCACKKPCASVRWTVGAAALTLPNSFPSVLPMLGPLPSMGSSGMLIRHQKVSDLALRMTRVPAPQTSSLASRKPSQTELVGLLSSVTGVTQRDLTQNRTAVGLKT